MKSLLLRDGDVVIFKNNDEALKELTDEEKSKLKRKDVKLRYGSETGI